MKEIIFFGRGGQGAVVASEILAEAYSRQGYQVQCFPSFGVERRGAPVTAFLRIDREFIYLRSMIYQAQAGLVFSDDIMASPLFRASLADNASVLVNTANTVSDRDDLNIHQLDASAIAIECGLGSSTQPLVNTAMLGAFTKIAGDLDLDHLLAAIDGKVPKNAKMNLEAARKGYAAVGSGE